MLKMCANLLTPRRNSRRGWDRKNYVLRRAGISIGKNVAIDRGFDYLPNNATNIQIADHAVIGINAKFWNYDEITIGKFCMFAADVTLVNGGHQTSDLSPFSGPLIVGNGCFLGNGARLIGPINVGDNAIVGAGSLVLKDVPPGAVVAGSPARIIRFRELESRQWHLGNTYFCPHSHVLLD